MKTGNQKFEEARKKAIKKQPWRTRIHLWLCDRFNVVSYDEFYLYCENIDKYMVAQDKFNRLIAGKLNLQRAHDVSDEKKIEVDNKERGMFG